MIIGIGADIVQIRRIGVTIKRFGQKFVNRIFTEAERDKATSMPFENQVNYYAKRYAAKEAVAKALGSGIGRLAMWQEIEVTNDSAGAPFITLSGQTKQTLIEKTGGKPAQIHLSLSDDLNALAFVVIETV